MQKGDSFLDFKARNRVDCSKRYILKNFLIIVGLWTPHLYFNVILQSSLWNTQQSNSSLLIFSQAQVIRV
jgi:hypothetical protein